MPDQPSSLWRRWLAALCAGAAVVLPLALMDDALAARATAIAGVCLVLWLSELVPPFVPSLLLLVAVPLALGSSGDGFSQRAVLGWAADPVLALFFGGFALGAACTKHGLDRHLADLAVRASRGRRAVLVALVLGATAFLSMWMSNIAAAAMMLTTAKPLAGDDARFRNALVLAVAMGANLGGIATPIGTGPNAIAMAAMAQHGHHLSFLGWMGFAVPLVAVALVGTWLLLRWQHRVSGPFVWTHTAMPLARHGRAVLLLAAITILCWLSEPVHGVPAAVIALGLATALFATRLLDPDDLPGIDWSTLLLIAGGLALGRLLEFTGLLAAIAQRLHHTDLPDVVLDGALIGISAALSALMSNTATATLLVPLAIALDPQDPAMPVLVALGCSLGMPFAISTPPNAMAVGAGAAPGALLRLGLPIMVLGVVGLAVVGSPLLRWMGLA